MTQQTNEPARQPPQDLPLRRSRIAWMLLPGASFGAPRFYLGKWASAVVVYLLSVLLLATDPLWFLGFYVALKGKERP